MGMGDEMTLALESAWAGSVCAAGGLCGCGPVHLGWAPCTCMLNTQVHY